MDDYYIAPNLRAPFTPAPPLPIASLEEMIAAWHKVRDLMPAPVRYIAWSDMPENVMRSYWIKGSARIYVATPKMWVALLHGAMERGVDGFSGIGEAVQSLYWAELEMADDDIRDSFPVRKNKVRLRQFLRLYIAAAEAASGYEGSEDNPPLDGEDGKEETDGK